MENVKSNVETFKKKNNNNNNNIERGHWIWKI